MKILFFAALFLTQSAFATENSCDSSKEIAAFTPQTGTRIVACGMREEDQVYDLKLLQVRDHDATSLFESDDAFKSYHLKHDSKSITIFESLSMKGAKPFLKISTSCGKTSCEISESCVWKKSKPNEKMIEEIQKLLHKKKGVSDVLWAQAFYSALNGSQKARQLFESQISENSNAAGSEAFETYKADIPRLKKAKCL